jgi:hypothetical protein
MAAFAARLIELAVNLPLTPPPGLRSIERLPQIAFLAAAACRESIG